MKIVHGLEQAREVLLTGRGLNLDSVPPHIQEGIEKVFGLPMTPAEVVRHILERVRNEGDAAVRDLTSKLDGADIEELEVPASAVAAAYQQVSEELVEALRFAAQRIQKFHQACMPKGWTDFNEGYGQIVNAVRTAGAYVPGGTALYPSTVLMTAIPARVAGVEEVIICTPTKGGEMPGPAMQERARDIVRAVEEANLAVGEQRTAPTGLLRITAPASVTRFHIAPAMAAFHARYPAVRSTLLVTDRVVDLVNEGLDIAIRAGQLEDSSLIVRKIGESRRLVCAAPAYLERSGVPRHPVRRYGEGLIATAHNGTYALARDGVCGSCAGHSGPPLSSLWR